ncbi:TolA protein [Bacillus phage vB_Bacillus_1020A]|jgi:hypothetical protein|uniref:hypothetical protein n=1 Tax=Robertmurraya sp. DFI.2.37 TaxID=3031819 RepID=UPI001247C524|nr:hypothetical protein [Robertmurraya sp. DFI.2.37]MDF1510832.1 hypothetical protein [Robertmurraya sp. DFI.2.37]QIW89313.1 TolA protein [Bacillus phage vB_Bacillus_1020A]
MYKVAKIYYVKTSGEVIHQSRYNFNLEPNFDEDYESFKSLNSRTKESIALLVLRDGEYAQSFQEGTLFKVDPETQELTFEYPNPENPEEPIIPNKPFEEQLAETIAYSVELDFRLTKLELGLN